MTLINIIVTQIQCAVICLQLVQHLFRLSVREAALPLVATQEGDKWWLGEGEGYT